MNEDVRRAAQELDRKDIATDRHMQMAGFRGKAAGSWKVRTTQDDSLIRVGGKALADATTRYLIANKRLTRNPRLSEAIERELQRRGVGEQHTNGDVGA